MAINQVAVHSKHLCKCCKKNNLIHVYRRNTETNQVYTHDFCKRCDRPVMGEPAK